LVITTYKKIIALKVKRLSSSVDEQHLG